MILSRGILLVALVGVCLAAPPSAPPSAPLPPKEQRRSGPSIPLRPLQRPYCVDEFGYRFPFVGYSAAGYSAYHPDSTSAAAGAGGGYDYIVSDYDDLRPEMLAAIPLKRRVDAVPPEMIPIPKRPRVTEEMIPIPKRRVTEEMIPIPKRPRVTEEIAIPKRRVTTEEMRPEMIAIPKRRVIPAEEVARTRRRRSNTADASGWGMSSGRDAYDSATAYVWSDPNNALGTSSTYGGAGRYADVYSGSMSEATDGYSAATSTANAAGDGTGGATYYTGTRAMLEDYGTREAMGSAWSGLRTYGDGSAATDAYTSALGSDATAKGTAYGRNSYSNSDVYAVDMNNNNQEAYGSQYSSSEGNYASTTADASANI